VDTTGLDREAGLRGIVTLVEAASSDWDALEFIGVRITTNTARARERLDAPSARVDGLPTFPQPGQVSRRACTSAECQFRGVSARSGPSGLREKD